MACEQWDVETACENQHVKKGMGEWHVNNGMWKIECVKLNVAN